MKMFRSIILLALVAVALGSRELFHNLFYQNFILNLFYAALDRDNRIVGGAPAVNIKQWTHDKLN